MSLVVKAVMTQVSIESLEFLLKNCELLYKMITFQNWLIISILLGRPEKSKKNFAFVKRIYTMTKHSDINLIPSENLTDFFIDHLKDKPIEIQPEVINPGHYPHILPSHQITYI